MFVIGLVGEKGSGKGAFAKILEEVAKPKQVVPVRTSGLVRETLDMWHIQPTRVHLQKLAVIMDQTYGVGTLAEATYQRAIKVEADIIIIESIRWDADVALIRRFPKNVLVYITAPPAVRHVSTISRGEKMGESETTFEQFMEEEKAENEIHIPRIGALADYTIRNEGTIEQYKKAITDCYQKHIIEQ